MFSRIKKLLSSTRISRNQTASRDIYNASRDIHNHYAPETKGNDIEIRLVGYMLKEKGKFPTGSEAKKAKIEFVRLNKAANTTGFENLTVPIELA